MTVQRETTLPFSEPYSFGMLYLMSLMHDYWTGHPLGTLAREAFRDR